MLAPRYQMQKYKYDGTVWGMYDVFLLHAAPERWVFWQPRGTFIFRNHGWAMRHDHVQFFYPGRWYAISANYTDEGMLRHCYCDVAAPWDPPEPGKFISHFVDLELDLHAEPTRRYRVYDEHEFAAAIVAMRYPGAIRAGARASLDSLIAAAATWQEPFASIPLVLPRNDFHQLDMDSESFRLGLQAMGIGG
jgi:protein associated with RNAse G/E